MAHTLLECLISIWKRSEPISIPAIAINGYTLRKARRLCMSIQNFKGYSSHDISKYLTTFKSEFDWVGTPRSDSLALRICSSWIVEEIGIKDMRSYGHNLAIDARKMLTNAFGSKHRAPEDMIGMLATIQLREIPVITDKHTATLHDRLRDEFIANCL